MNRRPQCEPHSHHPGLSQAHLNSLNPDGPQPSPQPSTSTSILIPLHHPSYLTSHHHRRQLRNTTRPQIGTTTTTTTVTD
ncbi:hypothetical protein BU24DRAFT_151955 [Aaosphaeria arxii CBS 175.79]|uniref:Uncharacterized protein n=1 Tax=Aaosphaeria arxii CBS 175.79 TaxID=1450172 RepID=A0A6A5XX32_9PLEO|nr:uncharacterized protein BU24DRAFT_151955 [Aaosphaeria arxii CBS 175.79]KAF2017516.1 hypothetical protein BU24DRAFT_151955 [Aaosphaeria arxii CBS 175.79]